MDLRRCARCHAGVTPASVVCPACLSRDFEAVAMPPQGRLVSWTTIRRAPAGYPAAAPYDVVVVDLAPGVRITGRLAAGSAPPRMDALVRPVAQEGACTLFEVAPG